MDSIYEALKTRADSLPGRMAPVQDVDELARKLHWELSRPLVSIFRELPVCGMLVEFLVDTNGKPRGPGPEFLTDECTEDEHAFDWESPRQIIEEIEEFYAGPAVFAAGFLPIGMCSFGNSDYYLDFREPKPEAIPLYRVHHDWIDPDAADPVPPEALHLVASSFQEVMRVARLCRGL